MWPVAIWFSDAESYERWSGCEAYAGQPEVELSAHLLIRLGRASALMRGWLGLRNRAPQQ